MNSEKFNTSNNFDDQTTSFDELFNYAANDTPSLVEDTIESAAGQGENLEADYQKYADRGEKTLNSYNTAQESNQTSPEQVPAGQEIIKEAKKRTPFKKLKAIAIALALTSVLTACGNKDATETTPPENQAATEQEDPVGGWPGQQNPEKLPGIRDGYDVAGMWESADGMKFADASEVARVNHNNPKEMSKYTAANQSESLADYIALLPESMQPEGFENATLAEAEQRLEKKLSDEEYDAVLQFYNAAVDSADIRIAVKNGLQNNAFMRLKDKDAPVTHDNMELVYCQTDEKNLPVIEYYWQDTDGNEIGHSDTKMIPVFRAGSLGDMIMNTNPELFKVISWDDIKDGIEGFRGCMQGLSDANYNPGIYTGTEKVTEHEAETGETDDSTGTETDDSTGNGTGSQGHSDGGSSSGSTGQGRSAGGDTNQGQSDHEGPKGSPDSNRSDDGGSENINNDDSKPDSKNLTAQAENSAQKVGTVNVVKPLPINNEVTPPTTIEQAQANFSAIEERPEEDARRAEEAARIKAEREAAERQAAAEAEARRRAEEEAEARRRAEAEEAARRAADEETRRQIEEAEHQRQIAEAEAKLRAAEAAAEAEAEARAKQEAAAATERQAAEEATAREQAQAAANTTAEQVAEEAASHANDTASERAATFNNNGF